MKRVLIVGGGVAGLTAGIYCRKHGYACTIFEQNSFPGGNLTGWERNGYYVDNCIHWLTGTLPSKPLYRIWTDTGALGNVSLQREEALFTSEADGQRISLWADTERTRREMRQLSPADTAEINQFIDAVNACKADRSASVMARWGRTDLYTLASRFRHPLLSRVMTDYIGGEFSSVALMCAYAAYSSGNGDVPSDGSRAMAERMAAKFYEEGGELQTQARIKNIVISGHAAAGLVREDGSFVSGDAVILACDPFSAFGSLLPEKFLPRRLRLMQENSSAFPRYSAIHAAFGVNRDIIDKGTTILDVPPFFCDGRTQTRLAVREFSSFDGYAPEGKTVVQVLVFLREKECLEWIDLAEKDHNAYEKKKQEFSGLMRDCLLARYPAAAESLELLDVWTPATYHRYFSAPCGSFLAFAVTGKRIPLPIPVCIPGLENVLLASQWNQAPGGLPTAAKIGRKAADVLAEKIF